MRFGSPSRGPLVRRRLRTGGMTMIEVVMAFMIIAVALMALLGALFSSNQLATSSTEDAEAMLFAQNVIEEMQGVQQQATGNPLSNILLAYSSATYTNTATNPNYTYSNGSAGDVSYTSLTQAASFVSATGQVGWTTPVIATNNGFREVGSRLPGKANSTTVKVHLMTELDFYNATGQAEQLDLTGLADPTTNVPSPASTTQGGVLLRKYVTSNYGYYPVLVSVTWNSSIDGRSRTVSVLGSIYKTPGRTQ